MAPWPAAEGSRHLGSRDKIQHAVGSGFGALEDLRGTAKRISTEAGQPHGCLRKAAPPVHWGRTAVGLWTLSRSYHPVTMHLACIG